MSQDEPKPLPQRCVIYGMGESEKVYQTCYTDAQVKHSIIRCVERYGKYVGARSVVGDSYGKGKFE
jgi:hypothetical protein